MDLCTNAPRLEEDQNVHRRKAFEDVWLTPDSRLGEVKGFVAFHLLRGPEREDHVLYSSHTTWFEVIQTIEDTHPPR